MARQIRIHRQRSTREMISAVFLASASLLNGAEASSSTNAVSFSNDIAPVLSAKCVTCHGPEKAKGRYRADSFTAFMTPGQSKDIPIVPGQPAKSRLLALLTAKDPDDRMPQDSDPLPAKQIALVERWIQEGANFDGADPRQSLVSLAAVGPQPDPPETYARPVPVLAVAFSPDGRELAAAGYHEITIWDPATGQLLRRIKNVAQQTQALAFSPDGALLAAASGTPGRLGEIKLFNPATGALVKTLVTTADIMLAVVFSPDGKRLAAAGADNAIRLFDSSTGGQQLAIEQHADWVLGIAFSPDGAMLASASRDKTARLFDTKSGELEQTYAGHGAAVFSVAFSGDGKRAFSASRDREIHVWETKDAKKITEVSGFEGDVVRVLVSSNRIFSASADYRVRQHSLEGKKTELVRTYAGHHDFVYGLAHDADTDRLASSSFDGEVRVWDVRDGTPRTRFVAAPGHTSAGSHARESP